MILSKQKRSYKCILILVILTLLISCSSNRGTKTTDYGKPIGNDLILNINDKSNIFELTSTSFFFSEEAELYGYDYTADRGEWHKIIQSKFGIDVRVSSLYEEYIDGKLRNYSRKMSNYNFLKEHIENGTVSGLFLIGDHSIISQLAEDELILPMENYLKNNVNWNSLPEGWRNAFETNGHLWGIPQAQYDMAFSRYLRKDWLDTLDMSVPVTINEFYEVSKAFRYDDPDNDQKPNTHGFIYNRINSLADIFAAFDARLNYNGDLVPAWNPVTNKYEDSFIKPEMIECLEFLKQCRFEGILTKSEVTGTNNEFYTGYAGSYYSSSISYGLAAEEISKSRPETENPSVIYLMGLTRNIEKNVTGYYTDYRNPYVLIKNSISPASTVNILIDVFVVNREGYILGNYGTYESGYTTEGDMIVYRSTVEEGRNIPYRRPMIIEETPAYDIVAVPDYMEESFRKTLLINEERMSRIKTSSLSFMIPWNVVRKDIDLNFIQRTYAISAITSGLFRKAMGGLISCEDAVLEYKREAEKLGIQDYLEALNDTLRD